MEPTPLNAFIYTQVTPDQVRHTLTEDGWSSFDFGPLRIQIPSGDLTRVTAAIEVAEAIGGQAGFWASDLREIRDRLTAAENARLTDPPELVKDLTSVPEPTMAEQIAAPDPKLDAAVERVVELADAQRDPEEEGDL
ncbi:hypothetical protein ACU635_51090 [[Actinomadura] parvosata]|uniref:hypothetical protein n=1 Tax=[Actinomadura] parvosata TaxID=1955412 RepID=UPI00406C6FBA